MSTTDWDNLGPPTAKKIFRSADFPIACASCGKAFEPGDTIMDVPFRHADCPERTVEGAALSAAFLDELIKRSPDADQILLDCGRLRLQRAALAAIELYLETSPPGGLEEASE